jgi:hypothetical protein
VEFGYCLINIANILQELASLGVFSENPEVLKATTGYFRLRKRYTMAAVLLTMTYDYQGLIKDARVTHNLASYCFDISEQVASIQNSGSHGSGNSIQSEGS